MTKETCKQIIRRYGRRSLRAAWAQIRCQPWRLAMLPVRLAWIVVCRWGGVSRLIEKRRLARIRPGAIRPIAFYLPQFHAIPENDRWWGEGFTEWTNVRKAMPLCDGHWQPHVPHPDLGYYDLADVSVMRRQAEIAKRHGVHGFCFYYYRFKDGKRLLEKPLDNWLANPQIDFPFCFCWANENWTRTWDGGEQHVLMPQDYAREDLDAMLEDMLPAFRDPRYLKVDGKPMLLVYRPEIIPGVRAQAESWRRIARENGFPGLHLVMVQNFSRESPHSFGLDAATEFSVGHSRRFDHPPAAPLHLDCRSYADVVRSYEDDECAGEPAYLRYKCICPNWDNTPRRGEKGRFTLGSTPELFGRYARMAFLRTLADERLRKDGFVFVNAWNEWGEGAHLEPDAKFGYGYLEALKAEIEHAARSGADDET